MWLKGKRFLELIRFSHTLFALPFALLASIWAWCVPAPEGAVTRGFQVRDAVGILLCMVLARSFAMAMNRWLDDKWDGENPRTAGRHLPAKLLGRTEVLVFAVVCGILFILSTLLFLPNRLPVLLSLPVLLFLAGYSLGKRFTWMVHFWLGVALMLAPICAWIAIRGEVVQQYPQDLLPATVLGLVVMLWVSGFDILYACQDADFDRGAGLHSIPSRFGIRGALRAARWLHGAMWLLAMGMTFWFPELSLGWIFRVAILGVGALLVFEHSVVSEKSLDRMQLAFFQVNAIVSVVILVAGSLDAWLR
ncbi:MAG: UbiA-like polyprenyltransferase [Planctomycetota bacterium]